MVDQLKKRLQEINDKLQKIGARRVALMAKMQKTTREYDVLMAEEIRVKTALANHTRRGDPASRDNRLAYLNAAIPRQQHLLDKLIKERTFLCGKPEVAVLQKQSKKSGATKTYQIQRNG